MDSFELNKIAGAVLFALLVAFGLSIFSEILFETHEPETPGYVIAVAEPPEGGEAEAGGGGGPQPIALLMASADPAAGEASMRKCASCHSFAEGEAPKVGPNLWGIVMRPIASTDYAYSEALVGYAAQTPNWITTVLSAFLHDPKTTFRAPRWPLPASRMMPNAPM
jgi:cytochrome c